MGRAGGRPDGQGAWQVGRPDGQAQQSGGPSSKVAKQPEAMQSHMQAAI